MDAVLDPGQRPTRHASGIGTLRIGSPSRAIEPILDEGGRLLCDVRLSPAVDRFGALLVEPAADPALLLDYYFNRCGRVVSLGLREPALRGRIETSWRDRRRVWYLHIETTPEHDGR